MKFLTKKGSGCICLSPPPGVELRGSKDCHVWNIVMYWNCKVDSLYGWMLQKLSIILKDAAKKNCSESNFLQKSQEMHLSISPGVELGAPKIAAFEIL